MDAVAGGWLPLAQAKDRPQRHGHKASRLAALREAGLPVPEGWVLAVDVVDALDAERTRALSTSLLELSAARRWLLRSSSPLEDAPSGTAAGVFVSASGGAVAEEVARALAEVAAAARAPVTLRALGRATPAPLAVLAQPHLRLQRWCTVEIREDRAEGEGWDLGPDGEPRWSSFDPEAPPTGWSALADLARRAHDLGGEPRSLIELGEDDSGAPWLLQLRRAPRVAAPRTPSAPTSGDPTRAGSRSVPGLGLRVHTGDESRQWIWDREHSPTALCPLLASVFARWILEHPEHPSRLAHGRWHDARNTDERPDTLEVSDVDALLADWSERERALLLPGLRTLREAVASPWTGPHPERAWGSFVDAWTSWQAHYFGGPSGVLRRWARARVTEHERRAAAGPVLHTDTVAGARERRWWDLATRLRAHAQAPAATTTAITDWLDAHGDDPLAEDLREERQRSGHLCAFAFDGRGVPWEFDESALFAQIARRMRARGRPSRVRSARHAPPLDERVRQVFARAEDDDDLLLDAYRWWHHAVRRAHEALPQPAPARASDLLDLLERDLRTWLRDGAAPHGALDRGRALATSWDAWPSDDATAADAGEPVATAHGIPAAPGRATGPVVRARTLAELPDDAPAAVAVVATIGPSDAVFVPGLLALVCEGGDRLGHASVLAREHAIPCVVGVGDARRRFAQARRLLVDGDRGDVVALDEPA